MADQRVPYALYEALPYVYMIIGVAAAIGSTNALGWVSGSTLVSAGLVIRHLRHQYRRAELLNRPSQIDSSSRA